MFKPGKSRLFWGRLIEERFDVYEVPGHLIYLYNVCTDEYATVPWERMTPENLLVPPMVTNRTPWTTGYFKTIDSRPLRSEERLAIDYLVNNRGHTVDGRGNLVAAQVSASDASIPTFGMNNIRLIDEMLKRRFHVPTLESVVDRRVASFCAERGVKKPEAVWINGIMLQLDSGVSDKHFLKYLSRAFPTDTEQTHRLLAAELRDDAGRYAPEQMLHVGSQDVD